jgi:hypothetical protein
VNEVEAIGGSNARKGSDDVVTTGLLVFGLYLVGISLFAAVAPGTFFEEVGPYGARSDHYIHDVAAFQGAVGVFLLLAVRRPTWRVPALAVAMLQFGFHALSHLVDIGDADPEWLGVAEFIGLAVATPVLAWLLARANRAAGA